MKRPENSDRRNPPESLSNGICLHCGRDDFDSLEALAEHASTCDGEDADDLLSTTIENTTD